MAQALAASVAVQEPGKPKAPAPVHTTQVAIVGGGLAGSLTAAMLGRAGIDAILVDPHVEYPADFRCEKLDGDQVAILKQTGLLDAVLRVSTPDRETWVARFGRLVDKRQGDQQGIYYPRLVNAIRAEIPARTRFIHAKATALSTSTACQTVTTSIGDVVQARLIVLANGLNIGLRDSLGLKRDITSKCHSISIGFDMAPVGRQPFAFPALTYYAEQTRDRTALLTLFPIGAAMRANLFVYRDMDDPWLQAIRAQPQDTIFALMPGLRAIIGDFAVTGRVQIRPVDLYMTRDHLQPGIVLVGDAFATSCPAAGTGVRKVLTDVERLCNVHIPQWLATPGMDVPKIGTFYQDPVKQACDRFSLEKAHRLKAFSIDAGLRWRLLRRAKFLAHYVVGMFRKLAPQRAKPSILHSWRLAALTCHAKLHQKDADVTR
jgi:2-polyprenyl-6-methoxyphenol hydroxylase-like FAD-dependent oxidoreductase